MQRRVAHAVALVDLRLRSAKNVQQSPVVGRVRDGVQAAEALYVEYAWVRALLEEQVDDVHEAVARGPLQRRGEQRPADRVYICALLDEVRACLGSAVDRSPVQWRDVVVVLVRRACATRLDQGSDSFGLAQLCGDEDVELRPSYVLPGFHIGDVKQGLETHLSVATRVLGIIAARFCRASCGSIEDGRCHVVLYPDSFLHSDRRRIHIIWRHCLLYSTEKEQIQG